MKIDLKQYFILIGMLIFGILFLIPTLPHIWNDFEIPKIINNPFISIISLFLFAVFLRFILEKYNLSEFCFIPDALIVVSLIGMLIEVQHINEVFKKGMKEIIEKQFDERDKSLQDAKEKLDQKTAENEKLKIDQINIEELRKEIKNLKENDQIIKSDFYIKADYDLAKKLDNCNTTETCWKDGDQLETEVCECKRAILKEAFDTPPSEDNIVEFNRKGYTILKKAGDLLKLDFGIDSKSFVGSAISSPFNKENQGFPEYWVPNKREDDNTVITCQFKNPSLVNFDKKIDEVLSKIKYSLNVSSDADCKNKQLITQVSERMQDKEKYKNNPPIMFRCARFPTISYNHSVGRPGAKRVYFSKLEDVENLSIANACSNNGTNLDRIYKDKEKRELNNHQLKLVG